MLTTFLIWTIISSLIAAALFVWDKRAAVKDRRRISERTLLVWSIVGGWPGALIAGQMIRHKTQKLSFRILFMSCVAIHVALSTWWIWRRMTWNS